MFNLPQQIYVNILLAVMASIVIPFTVWLIRIFDKTRRERRAIELAMALDARLKEYVKSTELEKITKTLQEIREDGKEREGRIRAEVEKVNGEVSKANGRIFDVLGMLGNKRTKERG